MDEPSPLSTDIRLAVSFLTRLPVTLPEAPLPAGALARAMRVFPLAGVLVGAIGAAAYAAAHMLLPPLLAAPLALAAMIAVTGGLHEDGLADCADGFGGGGDKERKLAIMKDSRIGSYGMLAVALALLLRTGALISLDHPGRVASALIAAHALARAVLPAAMIFLPPARAGGLGALAGQPDFAITGMAATLALGVTALALPASAAVFAVLGAAGGAALMGVLAWRQIGGQTGDVLGAIEQAAETGALMAIVATWGHAP